MAVLIERVQRIGRGPRGPHWIGGLLAAAMLAGASVPDLHAGTTRVATPAIGTAPSRSVDVGPVEMFDAASELIRSHFYDSDLNGRSFNALRRSYRPRFEQAETRGDLRELFDELFRELDASHLSWIERPVYESLIAELSNRRLPTFGVVLEETRAGQLFVRSLFEGGPGENAGLRLGDQIVSIEGQDPIEHPALVPAADDPSSGLAPLYLFNPESEALRLRVRSRARDSARSLEIEAVSMNGVDAARNSVCIFEAGEQRIGLVHLWYCQRGVDRVLKEALEGPLKDCDGLLLDIRGRGGFADMVDSILRCFPLRGRAGAQRPIWSKPVAVLIDERTRSAKELLAWKVRALRVGTLVGRHTEGAVLGAGFFELPDGSYLELPVTAVPVARGVDLEGIGVAPDVKVPASLPFCNGRDAILERGIEVLLKQLGPRPRVSGPY